MNDNNSFSKGRVAKTPESGEVRQAWRPKHFSSDIGNRTCPYCYGEIKASYAVCPHCGRSLTPGKCSFCGSAMKDTARFCTHCGQSREGVLCPNCGTLNSRNFCRNCNTPLTPMAQSAMAAAKNDPAFQAIETKARELAGLHRKIEELRNSQVEPSGVKSQISEADRALLDEYADILGALGCPKPKTQQPSEPTESDTSWVADTDFSLDEIMAAYREKAAEMNEALSALTPPEDYTPEQQRDYFSARKIATMQYECDMSGYVPTLWKCNYCGFLHQQPSECAEPQLGGTWIYQDAEEYRIKHQVATTLKVE